MLRAFAAVFCCVSWSLAQAPGPAAANDLRGPAIGEVRDANGKPWVSAEVVLLSRPLPHDANAGEVDRVVAKVDERGRFRASILRGRPYTVWAWGDADEKGRPASAVADHVFVQQPVVLKQERVLTARDVVLEHCERWEGFTFRVRVVDQTWNRDVHVLDVKDGRARLPWLVAGSATIDVLAVREGIEHPLTRASAAATSGDVAIDVPEHKVATCFATDEGGAAHADASIFRNFGDVLYRVGATNAEGKFSLDFSETSQLTRVTTLVRTADGAMGVFGPISGYAKMPGFTAPAGSRPEDFVARVRGGSTAYARFIDERGEPLRDLEVWHSGLASSRPTRSSGTSAPWFTTSRTDRDGVVRLFGALPAPRNKAAAAVRIDAHVLLRERDLASLPAAWRQGLLPIVFSPLVASTGKGTAEDPFVVTPTALCPVELTFVGAGGTPASNTEIVLAAIEEDVTGWWPRRNGSGAICDERGRIRVLVPAARHLGLSATSGMSLLVRAFETTPGRTDSGAASATLQMPAPTGIRGRLVDPAGKPWTDGKVTASFGTENVPAEWDYAIDPASALASAKGNALRVLLPETAPERLQLTALIGSAVPVDAEGRFALPLPPVRIPGLMVYRHPDNGFISDSRNVDWRGDAIEDFELTITAEMVGKPK